MNLHGGCGYQLPARFGSRSAKGKRVGVVLSVHDPRRLRPVYHRPAARHSFASQTMRAGKLCKTMKSADVIDTLELALESSGYDQAPLVQKPRLLSDNGSSHVASDLANYLEGKGMDHVCCAPHHPQSHGKIE